MRRSNKFRSGASRPKPAIRRFRHIGGFGDRTNYLEWDGKRMWIVYRNYRRRANHVTKHYPLSYCLRKVDENEWIELSLKR